MKPICSNALVGFVAAFVCALAAAPAAQDARIRAAAMRVLAGKL